MLTEAPLAPGGLGEPGYVSFTAGQKGQMFGGVGGPRGALAPRVARRRPPAGPEPRRRGDPR